MTDAEKLADYDKLVELLKDRIALEKHHRRNRAGSQTIQELRADAYEAVIIRVLGAQSLPDR